LTVRAKASLGVPLGLLFMTLLGAVDWLLLRHLLWHDLANQQINFLSFLLGLLLLLSLPLLAVLAHQTLNCATLRYYLDRNGFVIRWGGTQRVIPIGAVQQILPGDQIQGTITHRHGLHWPGHERGRGRVPGIGQVEFLATRPWPDQLLLVTPRQSFAISPRSPERFQEAFTRRRELGPNRLVEMKASRAGWLTWPFWTDRTARVLLGAALIINLGLFAYLCLRFPRLDLQLPLHFNSLGQADRIGDKMELFALPIIGLIMLGTNLALGLVLYKRERAGAYLLWGSAASAQILFWLATLSLIP
jgi:Bacterial PH domain/Domain of unknown function (DUF1648)